VRLRPAALVVVLVGTSLLLAACGSSTPTATTSTSSTTSTTIPNLNIAVLAPATVPPMVNECRQSLSYSADGNASPLTCASGGLNVLAWRFYASVGTAVMSLGRSATLHQIYGAMCTDMSVDHATNPEENFAATLASEYYGWNVVSQVSSFEAFRSCPS
jgi:hypothetical protein